MDFHTIGYKLELFQDALKRYSMEITLFEIFIFCPKIQLWFPEKTRQNVVVLDFLAVDNFDFTRKIVKKIWLKN